MKGEGHMGQATVGEQAVVDRARELGRAIGASKAYRNYERALERYQDDPSAADLLEQLRRVEQEASTQEMLWGNPGGDWAEKLASLQQQIRAHPVIRQLQQAETELGALLFGTVLKLGDVTGIDYAEACTGRALSGCGPARPAEESAAALRDSPEVSAAVQNLGRSIQETDAFQRFKAARSAFQNDPGVVRIREQVRSAVGAYVEAQKNGSLTLDVIGNVRTAQNRLREHPLVQNFSRKRQDVHSTFQVVNQIVGEVLGIDIAQVVAPASGCCG
jgi:cell fate (sporulation/competence/biofilm development) regulator YlbF (YheA/YmcA/DUF963 family)